MEYCSNGDLAGEIEKKIRLGEKKAIQVLT